MTPESLVSTAVPCPFPVGGSPVLDLYVVTVWDPQAAYSLARALVIRESHESAECGAALKAIESATRAIETQIKHVADVKTWADTIRNNGEKIADRAGKMQDALRAQVDELDRQLGALKS